MKMKKYYNFLSKRLMSIYVIYITLFTLVAYSMCLIYVRNDFRRTEKQYLFKLSNDIENHLSYVMDITATLNNNQTVLNFSTGGKDIDYAELTNVWSIMNQINIVNNYGSEFAVINAESGTAVTAEGSMSVKFLENKLGIKDSRLQKILRDSSLIEKNTIEILTSYSETHKKNYLITFISSKTTKDKPTTFVFMYNLDTLFKNVPNNHLPQIINIKIDKSNVCITYHSKGSPTITYSETEKGLSYKVVSEHMRSTNFWGNISSNVYVSTLSYYLYINNFFMFLLLFIVAMALIGHLYIKSNTNRIYNPIRKMLRTLPNEANESDDEFETMGQYFSALVSQKNAMSEIISENKIQLRDRFITQLMTSSLSKETIKSELVSYGLEDISFPGVTCVISYKNFDELKNILTMEGLGEVRDAVKECFSKQFADAKFFKMLDLDQQTFAVIICNKDINSLENSIKKCVLSIELMLDINMIVFMGCKAESWYDIPTSYSEAISLKNRSRIITDQSIVVSAKNSSVNSTIVYSTEQETELMNYVLAQNTNMVSICLEKIIDANIKDNFLPHEYFSHFVTMLYSTIIKLLTKINKTEKEVFAPMSVYLELMKCEDSATLKITSMNLFSVIISNVINEEKSTTIDSTEHIISYIDKNYSKDISLFTLAEYLNMSQSYASKTFKQVTGENFKDYLTNVRLTKAVEIMESDPFTKLSEVAKRVGYSSETFTRAFTKKYNMTPSAYMQKKRL